MRAQGSGKQHGGERPKTAGPSACKRSLTDNRDQARKPGISSAPVWIFMAEPVKSVPNGSRYSVSRSR
jgi:hypothetical protein